MFDNLIDFWDKYQAVIFDCDDTLILTMQTRWLALIKTAGIFGTKLSEDTIRSSWGKPFDQLIADLIPNIDINKFLPQYRVIMKEFQPLSAPGVESLLQYLYRKNKILEIVTSSDKNLILQDLDQLGLTIFFDEIFGYEQTFPYFKPNARVLAPVLQKLNSMNLYTSNILYVGDSVKDYIVAKGNDLNFIGVITGMERIEDFQAHGVEKEHLVATLQDLVPTP